MVKTNIVAHAVVPIESASTSIVREVHGALISSGLCISAEVNVEGTRFLRISKWGRGVATGFDKTTITFGLQDRPGALSGALCVFSEEGCNLLRIQSLPASAEHEHQFYVDVEGHIEEPRIQTTLDRLGKISVFCRPLGSYPRVRASE